MKPVRPKEASPIDVVEAAYDLASDERTWLRQIAERVRPLLDPHGLGMLAYPYDLATQCGAWASRAVTIELDLELVAHIFAMQASAPDASRAMHLLPDVLMTGNDELARAGFEQFEGMASFYKRYGGCDCATLQTVEPSGRGVAFIGMLAQPVRFEPRTKRLWRRVGAHIAAGRRLREALAAHGAPIEAVLTPAGRVVHAEGETRSARDVLRESVARQERARGRERHEDPAKATEAWAALVSGRWSLVDQFESDGRRYFVARRNELILPDPRALTAREHAITRLAALGKANKLIAYELGLSESTVATHLSTAMRKLGARTRVNLVELVAQLLTCG